MGEGLGCVGWQLNRLNYVINAFGGGVGDKVGESYRKEVERTGMGYAMGREGWL
jgi:hypothetical protein